MVVVVVVVGAVGKILIGLTVVVRCVFTEMKWNEMKLVQITNNSDTTTTTIFICNPTAWTCFGKNLPKITPT